MQYPAIIWLAMSLGLTACSGPTPNMVIHAATGDAARMPVTWGPQPPAATAPAPTAPPVTQTQTVNVLVGPTSGLEPARQTGDSPAAKRSPTDTEDVEPTEAPTVTGAQEIKLANGEQIRYSGPASFFLLDAKKGLLGMFLVDVRELDPGYMTDVWLLDGEEWRHGTMLRRLSLSSRTNMPLSPPPPRSMLDRFNQGVTWLVSDGAVVPGPLFYQALYTLFGRQSNLDSEDIHPNDAARRNVFRFLLALAHFHNEEMRPCDHLSQYSGDLFAGFVRMNRASSAPWTTRARIPGNQ
ncbi:hypothetical protein [Polyangium sp. y55x31]|uniref:hypothetical protein n=1 Tax=Polyangium sp. y55x31 TaxID=3042688 RepID=UPI0024830ADD|nr:hypothetical protein [Polyangium sp. y55x31]MDI1484667.1 hypothetical protein [Polyangium sp. y55x31]